MGDLEYRKATSAFENIAHSIIEQMLSMKAGHTIERRLREACGGNLSPEAVASLSTQTIRSCGVSMRKAECLVGLAEYACAHDLEAFSMAEENDIRASLTALPGIGKWTCDMFLLFYLGFPDILPIEDGALRQAFQWLYGAPITNPDVRQVVCSLWSPYSSTAVRYLYRALNEGVVKNKSQSEILKN